MKKIIVLFLLALPALGQKTETKVEKKGKIRIEKDINGKREVIEREFDPLSTSDSSANLILRFGEGQVWADDVARTLRRARTHFEGFSPKFSFSDGFTDGFSSVSVFTNKPDTHVLNVRFKSSKEDDVDITVVDPQGKVLKKDRVKDFAGEYMGQLELPKGSKGVVFVLIAQGENALSRKVTL